MNLQDGGTYTFALEDEHWLTGGLLEDRVETPNMGGAFGEGDLDTIVIHYTAGANAASAIRSMTNPNHKASAHLVIGRDKSITQLVPFNRIAWHAGKSYFKEGDHEKVGLNRCSIGIEIDNAGQLKKNGHQYLSWFGRGYGEEDIFEGVHRNQTQATFWHRYTEEQIEIVAEVCSFLVENYTANGTQIKYILGHEEISPKRKIDPGPAFPLDKLRDRILRGNRDADVAEDDDEVEAAFAGRRAGVVTASKLNIRAEASSDAKKVGPPLEQGSRVQILEEKNSWYKVKAEVVCWVSKKHVDRLV